MAAWLLVAPAPAPAAQEAAPAAGPRVSTKGAILVDAATGAVLWERQGTTRRAPASLTKMLTALTAEASLPPTRRLTVSAKAAAVQPTKVGLFKGRHVTVEQALQALMLISANDMAISLAEGAGRDPDGGTTGTAAAEARFIKALNAQSERLGMDDSTWKTPNGLDAPGHRATPFDLAIAARAVLRDPKLAKVVRRAETLRIVTPDGIRVSLVPRNAFLRTYPGAVGIKTGFTDDAGHCLAAAATRNGRTLIAIVLDSPDPATAAASMMNWGFGPGRAERTGQRLPDYVAPAGVGDLLAPPPPPTTAPLPDIDPELAPRQPAGLGANALTGSGLPSLGQAATSPAVLFPGAATVATGCSAMLLFARRRRRKARRAAGRGRGRGGAHAAGAGRAAGRHQAGARTAARSAGPPGGHHAAGASWTPPAPPGAWPGQPGWLPGQAQGHPAPGSAHGYARSPEPEWPAPAPHWPEPRAGWPGVDAGAGAGPVSTDHRVSFGDPGFGDSGFFDPQFGDPRPGGPHPRQPGWAAARRGG